MALTQKLHALINGAKEDWNARERAKRTEETDLKEKLLASLEQTLILGLGEELWAELKASGANIKASMMLSAHLHNFLYTKSSSNRHLCEKVNGKPQAYTCLKAHASFRCTTTSRGGWNRQSAPHK